MAVLVTGALLLASILGLFWLDDRVESPHLARLVHSGLTARLAVIAMVFMGVGVLLVIHDLIN